VVEKYHLGVFVEPDDAEEVLRGASKFVPNSATDEPATRYSPLLHLLGIAMNARIPGRKMRGKCWRHSLSLRSQALIIDI